MRQKAQSEIEEIVEHVSDISIDRITHYTYDEAHEQDFNSSVVTVINANDSENVQQLISKIIDNDYDINRNDEVLRVMINHTVSQRFNPSGSKS